MSLSKLFDKIREQNLKYIPLPPPKPKTRPETDEEFQYRAFHTPFYCKNCGSMIYPEWEPSEYNQKIGTPTSWRNVQHCSKCGVITLSTTIYYTWHDDCWNVRGVAEIFRKRVLVENQIQINHSNV